MCHDRDNCSKRGRYRKGEHKCFAWFVMHMLLDFCLKYLLTMWIIFRAYHLLNIGKELTNEPVLFSKLFFMIKPIYSKYFYDYMYFYLFSNRKSTIERAKKYIVRVVDYYTTINILNFFVLLLNIEIINNSYYNKISFWY